MTGYCNTYRRLGNSCVKKNVFHFCAKLFSDKVFHEIKLIHENFSPAFNMAEVFQLVWYIHNYHTIAPTGVRTAICLLFIVGI